MVSLSPRWSRPIAFCLWSTKRYMSNFPRATGPGLGLRQQSNRQCWEPRPHFVHELLHQGKCTVIRWTLAVCKSSGRM